MYNRRKTEHSRAKRTVKKSKVNETFSSSYMQYAKVFLIWAFLMGVDFLLEFRFEYLWPCWLLLRSVHDSFKYQGLLFSLFFLTIALLSDVICYLFVPVTLLFFLGSYYVWVQLLWQTDRGICLPTAILCILFLYVEFSYRLRLPKSVSLNFDLCRPFAAHCIGYPVVTLGFGVKSYVSYRFRLRKQAEVQEENAFYMDLIDEALPEECRSHSRNQLLESKRKHLVNGFAEQQEELEYCEQHLNATCTCNSNNSALALPPSHCEDTPEESSCSNAGNSCKSSLTHRASKSLANTLKTTLASMTNTVNRKLCSPAHSNGYLHSHSQSNSANSSETASTSSTTSLTNHTTAGSSSTTLCNGVNGSVHHSSSSLPTAGSLHNGSVSTSSSSTRSSKSIKGLKDETYSKFEADIKRLKSELQSSRSCEAELRNQLLQASQAERSARMELEQIRQDAESSQNRIHNLVQRSQSDRSQVQQMEKRLSEERKQKQQVEQQLANEKKARREQEQQLQSANHRQNISTSNSSQPSVVQSTQTRKQRMECTDWCKNKRRELESDVKSIRRDLHQRDDRLKQTLDELSRFQKLLDDREKALITIKSERDRLNHLLSDENRIKQELFTAYHAAMKENNVLSDTLTKYKCEVHSLKTQLYNPDFTSFLGSPNLSGSGNGLNWANSTNQSLPPYDFSQLPVQSSMLSQQPLLDSGINNQITNGSPQNHEQSYFSPNDAHIQQLLNLISGGSDMPSVSQHLHSNSSSPGIQTSKLQQQHSGLDNATLLPGSTSSANLSSSIDSVSGASIGKEMNSVVGYLPSSSPHF